MSLARKISRRINDLPPLPGVVTKVMELTANPDDFDMNTLVKTVSMDPGITARVLKVCNSTYFGLRHKVASLEQALPHLGVNNLLEVVMGTGLSPFFKGSQQGYRLARGQLWRHSMATALIAKGLAHKFCFEEINVLHTSALLHDVGKLILTEFVADRFKLIEALVMVEGWPLSQAEKKVLKMDHAELGSVAAKKWKLPDSVRAAIANHHNPAKSKPPRTLVNIVSLANHLAVMAGAGGGFGDEYVVAPPTVLFELNVFPQQLAQLADEMRTLLERAAPLLALADG